MSRSYSGFWVGVLGLLGACAQEAPGTPPPLDQLFYPTSMVLVNGQSDSEQRIIVSNANFDQRYNASTVMVLSVDDLFALSSDLQFDQPKTDMPITSAKRVPSLSGELAFVGSSSTSADGRVFVSARGQNRLTMLRLQNGELDCSNGKLKSSLGLDCTDAHVVDSGGSDPFALVHVPSTQGSGWMATAHLRATARPREEIRPDVGIVTFAAIDLFEQRIADELLGGSLTDPILQVTVPSLTGVSGLVFRTHDVAAAKSELLVVDMHITDGAVSTWELTENGSDLSVRSKSVLSLGSEANILSTRGMVSTADKSRVYVSVRFSEGSSSFNSGIAVLAAFEGGYRLVHVYEYGSELGPPSLLETKDGRRLLYTGDIRTDRIWILDVTSDAPSVVGELTGRAMGQIDGASARLRILDGPTSIVFARRGAKILGFVANFANSTIAVMEVSDADPRKHYIVGRLGEVMIEPDGTTEGDPEE